MPAKYDYLVVGAGLFGSTFAYEARKRGFSVLVVEKRPHIGGNCYSEDWGGIHVHMYGPHIFHTASKSLFEYLSQFTEFNNYSYRGKAMYKGRLYSMPINLATMQQIWGVTTPEEAEKKLAEVRIPCENPRNLEEHILAQVGQELYEKFIYGYTAKQWNREPSQLPKSIIERLPIRSHFSDRWFKDSHMWEGVPIGGYTAIFDKMLADVEIQTNVDFFESRQQLSALAHKIVFTGPIDEFFGHRFGNLEYRSLKFEHEVRDNDFQGTAIVTYTEREIPFTRIVEHKHFEFNHGPKTVITREYPANFSDTKLPFYPVRDDKNSALYLRYRELAQTEDVIFGGRLARYQYYDMDQTLANALSIVRSEFDQ